MSNECHHKIITDLPAITAIVNVVADIVLMPDAILISEEGVKGKQYRMKIGVKPFSSINGRSAGIPAFFFG